MFGEYPFVDEKYGQADFLWGGGMEHQTCTSYGSWNEGLYAHEIAHQWWGDMITCDTYHHFEYPFKMMASIHKALRPGGQFIIIDFKDKSWHVRTDSKTVIEEVTGSGFKLIDSREILDRFFIARFMVVK